MGYSLRAGKPSRIVTSHLGQRNLAIIPWVVVKSATVTAAARGGGENGEFCVAVAPATRTAGILTQLVKGAGC